MKSLQHNRAIQGTDQNLIQQNIQDFGSNQERLAMLQNSNEILTQLLVVILIGQSLISIVCQLKLCKQQTIGKR